MSSDDSRRRPPWSQSSACRPPASHGGLTFDPERKGHILGGSRQCPVCTEYSFSVAICPSAVVSPPESRAYS